MANEKELTINDMYKLNNLLNEAEEIIKWTKLDSESILINNITCYFKLKRDRLFN